MQYRAISQPFNSLCLSFLYFASSFLYVFFPFEGIMITPTIINGIYSFFIKKSMVSLG